jgi:hypothetical protein
MFVWSSCGSSNNIKTKMNTELWRNYTDRGNRNTGRETCPSATLLTTNLTWTGLGSNTGLCCDDRTASCIIRIMYVNPAPALQRTRRVCIAGSNLWTSYCPCSVGHAYRIQTVCSCSSWYIYLPLCFKVLHVWAQSVRQFTASLFTTKGQLNSLGCEM